MSGVDTAYAEALVKSGRGRVNSSRWASIRLRAKRE
jgi:hypothetical protein